MRVLQKRVEKILHAQGLYTPACTILAACSGGTDSLALLDILLLLRERAGARIICAHYDHGIRGDAAHADARFVEEFCSARDVPFVLESGDVPSYARAHSFSLETAGRSCRYAFLRRVAAEYGCACIAVAHHADDLAETVLMRILRGTGAAGLAAMRVRDGDLVRPLLTSTRAEVEAYVAERGLTPRHDVTNDQMNALRNRLRHELIPQLAADYNPAVRDALTRLSGLAGEEDDLLAGLAAQVLGEVVRSDGLSLRALRALHPALQRRVLRLFWAQQTGGAENFSYVHEEALRQLLTADGAAKCMMPRGYCAYARYGRLVLRPQEVLRGESEGSEEIFLPLEREYGIINFQGIPIEFRRLTHMTTADLLDMQERRAIYADLAALPQLSLRKRRGGDYMRLSQGRKKLKEIFIDDKIPREERGNLPLLALFGTSEIFWMVGGRRSTLAPVTPSSTDIVRIVCVKESTAK